MSKSIPESKRKNGLSPFGKLVESALKLVDDATQLGESSPLAAPYLLSPYITESDGSPYQRGKIVRDLLEQSIEHLSGKFKERFQQIIRIYYFGGYSEKDAIAICGIKKGTFQNNRKDAIEQIAIYLVEQLNPSLRLEAPPVNERRLFGRSQQISACEECLAAGQTVTLIGEGGVGKTTLAAYLSKRWHMEHVLWYTFRPGLNDHVASLLYALAYRLKHLDQPTLWQEIISGTDISKLEHQLAILRYAFHQLEVQGTKLLLCFDEVDLLQSADNPNHAQIVQFIDSLRNEVAILLVGQQAVLTSEPFFELQNLSPADTQQMLVEETIELSNNELQLLHAYTNGNPRLVELFIALKHYGETVATVLETMAHTPPLEFFLSRVVQRLHANEIMILKAAAVYRSSAPLEVWQNNKLGWALERLLKRRILISDGQGGMTLLPAYKRIIYELIDAEERQQLHGMAAATREERGAYTAALYHWIESGHIEVGISRWRSHQRQEVNQGQAHAALKLFRGLEQDSLSPVARQTHALICANLAQLVGDPKQALQDLRSALWSTPILKIDADIAKGVIANNDANYAGAREYFEEAVSASEALVQLNQSMAHKGMSWGYLQELDLDAAWRSAQYARLEAENVLAQIKQEQNEFNDAQNWYYSAMFIAEELDDKEGIAKIANSLITLLAIQGKFAAARDCFKQADQHYESIGKQLGRSKANLNLAFAHNLSEEYGHALEAVTRAKSFAENITKMISPQIQAHIHYQSSEAHLGLGELVQAEEHAQALLVIEEEYLMPDCYRLLGEIALQHKNYAAAESLLHQSIELNQNLASTNVYMDGYAWRALGLVFTQTQKSKEASTAFHNAIEIFEEINLPHEVEKTKGLSSKHKI